MRALLLVILILAFFTQVHAVNVMMDYGLEWGINVGDSTSYRLVETSYNSTYGQIIMEDVLIFLKVETLSKIPDNITSFFDVPVALGSMISLQGEEFVPYLSTLDIYPPVFINSSLHQIAMPIGNWSLITDLCLEWRFHVSENDTHWSILRGARVLIVPTLEIGENDTIITILPMPTTPISGGIDIITNETFCKENGVLTSAEGSWQNNELLLEYKMVQVEVNTFELSTSTLLTSWIQMFDHENRILILAATGSASILLIVFMWRKKTE